MEIPSSYFIQKLYQYGYKVKKTGNDYISCCPYCREGKSWGKKTRLYYFPSKNYLWCHNCNGHWFPYTWLKDIAGMEYKEIMNELLESGFTEDDIIYEKIYETNKETSYHNNHDLPLGSINILDNVQISHYKTNEVYKKAKSFLRKRRMLTAKFRPKTYYFSITDSKHKNRLIIPYYYNNKIVYYQSRALFEDDINVAKYFFKVGAENKELFNFDKVSIDLPRIYLTEGSIDAMFIQNGVSFGGVHLTNYQSNLLRKTYPFHELVIVLDNPLHDKTVDDKIKKYIDAGYSLFFWGGKFKKYKDFSQMAEENKIDQIPTEELDQFVFSGKKAELVLNKIILARD